MNISQYVTFDLPVPYKNILIYPVTVKDFFLFNVFSECLTVEKNAIPDPKIISMTNLEYIYYSSTKEGSNSPYLIFLDRLLAMVLKDDGSFKNIEDSIFRYKYNEKGKPIFNIEGEAFTSSDFEEIKGIIVEQNLVELPDENISKEVRDSLEKAREYKRRISGEKIATLEDYLISISSATGWSFEYLYGLTIRRFLKTMRRYDNFIHYQIYLAASLSGMVEFKDKSFIKHWLTNVDTTEEYKDVSVDMEAIQGKISLEDAKADAKAKAKR